MGLAENVGSGFYKMMNGWKEHYGSEPDVGGDLDHYRITFPLTGAMISDGGGHTGISEKITNGHPQTLDVRQNMPERWSERWSEISLNVREKQIILLVDENPGISRREMAKILGINQSALQKHMDNLKRKGIIRRIGPARGGYWEIVEGK